MLLFPKRLWRLSWIYSASLSSMEKELLNFSIFKKLLLTMVRKKKLQRVRICLGTNALL